jgi:hypothetical protein
MENISMEETTEKAAILTDCPKERCLHDIRMILALVVIPSDSVAVKASELGINLIPDSEKG